MNRILVSKAILSNVWKNATQSKPFILACVETRGGGTWTMLLLFEKIVLF